MADLYLTTQSTLQHIINELGAKFMYQLADTRTLHSLDPEFQNLVTKYKSMGAITLQFNAKAVFNQNSRTVEIMPVRDGEVFILDEEDGKVYSRRW